MNLLRSGVDPAVMALWLGHANLRSVERYINSRVLHQAGEKPQVSWSVQALNELRSPMADAF